MSPPELAIWYRVKHTRQLGYPFRRQHPLGPFVADFYCHAAALVVEIDGSHHSQQVGYDNGRDAWMTANGLLVLRFTAIEVNKNVDAVAATCLRVARERFVERGGASKTMGL